MNLHNNISVTNTILTHSEIYEFRSGREILDRNLYPFKSHYFNINGLRVHYLDEGEGETVLMLPGNPTWSFYYRDLIKALRPHYRVIVPDYIGMGLSDKPDDNRYRYTSARRIEDLGRLIDHLKLKKFTLVGHDWGGMLGTAYATMNPEKINAMIMMNTAGFMWPLTKKLPFALFLSRLPLGSALFIRGLNAYTRGAIILGMNRRWMSYEVAKNYLYPYRSWKDRIAIHRFVQDIPLRPGDPGYDTGLFMESRLKLLRDVPKLFCWGMRDFIFCRKMLDEWIRHFPDAEVHRFPDAGHLLLEDSAEDVIPIVEKFMKENIGPGKRNRNKKEAHRAEKERHYTSLAEHFLNIANYKPESMILARLKGLYLNGVGGVYDTITCAELDRESNRIAHGLEKTGITKGMHVAVMIEPGPDFFIILAGIMKIGAVAVLADQNMGLRNLKKCMAEAEPAAFIGLPRAHLARVLHRWAKKTIRINITLGRRYFWGGHSISHIKNLGSDAPYIITEKPRSGDMAMLIYTVDTGGIPKGVVYTHGILSSQLKILGDFLNAQRGDAALTAFPTFAFYGPACGVKAVMPDMNMITPASTDPRKIITAIRDHGCTSMFCPPALIDTIGKYGEVKGVKLPSLRKVVAAGGTVSVSSLQRFARMLGPGAQIYTPYGAAEALPVTLTGSEFLPNGNIKLTERGAGVCVGHPVRGMEVAIIKVSEDPIDTWQEGLKLPNFRIGEITVKGPVVTPVYYKCESQARLAKISDPRDGTVWHRMGDVGYLDDDGRLWLCGRKSHRVETARGTLYSIPCEAIFNNHPKVVRSALVGVRKNGRTVPAICIELEKGVRLGPVGKKQLTEELLGLGKEHAHTQSIDTILYHRKLPVDIFHNARILREKLAIWAQKEAL
jgi:olefin beta-lactone synthetase